MLGPENQRASICRPRAAHETDPGHQAEGGQPIPGAACELRARNFEALHESPGHDALREGHHERAGVERLVPDAPGRIGLEAELECDAAEDQGNQHDQHRNVERRHQDRVGNREHAEQAGAAEDEPDFMPSQIDATENIMRSRPLSL